MSNTEIIINSRKYYGSIRRSWKAGVVSQSDSLIVAVGRFDQDVEHSDLGLIKEGTVSFEHFWLDRWYNVFRFHEPDGTFRNYYCNIAMPAVWNGSELDFVDLDIDVVVWPDGRVEVLDRDDLERNTQVYGYPADLVVTVEDTLASLLIAIENKELP